MIRLTWYTVCGLLFFIFRLWLDEIKLRRELDFRRHYFSRTCNYFFSVALINNFENMVFNLILATCMVALWVAFFRWDFRFYKRFKTGGLVSSIPLETRSQKVWLIIERLTLHPPILIVGTIPFFTGLRSFVLGSVASNDLSTQIVVIIYASILAYGGFFFLDIRWYERYGWPTGKYMLIAIIASCIIIFPIILIPTLIEIGLFS